MKRADSIYSALSTLHEFIRERNIPLKEREIDEVRAYAEAIEGVHEIRRDKSVVKRKRSTDPVFPTRGPDPRRLLEATIRDKGRINVTNMPDYMEGYAEGINPLTFEKLKAGEFSVQKILDLHGFSMEDAKGLFEEFVTNAIRSGLQCIKVVHGRGLKSKRGPVLKEALKTWILQAMHRKWVAAFSSARMCDGGPGATCILLRSHPKKKHIRIIG